MSAQIIYGVDFRSKAPTYKVAEGPTDFAALEAEISLALWNQDAGTIGVPVPTEYDPGKSA